MRTTGRQVPRSKLRSAPSEPSPLLTAWCANSWIDPSELRSSWNYNLTSYEAKRLLNLDEEPGFGPAMSENRRTSVTETTWKSSNPSHPPSAPITRANSEVSLYMPVRRRSIIQTPGVATRSSSTRDLPPLPPLHYRHSHPATPSVSRKQSIESYRSGVVSMPPPHVQGLEDPEPRVMTPCEDKYLSIGAFKLGSLRITNGSPIPLTPDIDSARGNAGSSAGQATAQDGYFSRTQAPGSGISAAASAQGPVLSPRFLSEISQSPLTSPPRSQAPSRSLQTTSKATALDDLLFEDDAQPEYSSIEVLDIRLDPNAKPPHAQLERDTGSGVSRTDSGFVSTASPASSEIPYKPLAKADSGYSSNVSLRSFQAKSRVAENQSATPSLEKHLSQSSAHEATPASPEEQSPWSQTEVYPAPPERESPPPPVPPKDFGRYSSVPRTRLEGTAKQRVSMPSLVDHRTSSARPTRHSLNLLVTHSPGGGRGPASPESEVRSPLSVGSSTSDNSGSGLSIGSGSQKPGRLQRFLSGARRPAAGPPVAHPTHALEQGSVPPVPQEVEHKLHDRADRFLPTAKRLTLKSRPSLDTLKTIFSVGSLEISLDAVNSLQTVPTAPEAESKEGLWKQTLASVPAFAAHVIPRKPITRKPVPVRRDSTTEQARKSSSGRESEAPGTPRAVDGDAPIRSPEPSRRTMSLTFLADRGLKLRRRVSDLSLTHSATHSATHSTTDLPSPALPSPVAKAMAAENSRTPQSTNTNTARRPLSLRVPPPLRPVSLSRKTSRESIQSYPAMHTLASKPSMDSLYSHTSSQPGGGTGSVHSLSPSGISMDPRRLQSFRGYHSPQASPYNSPDWEEVQADHSAGRRTPQTFTPAGSRRNSISSIQSEGGFHPHSVQAWQVRTAQQPLRHRASYDGYSSQQRLSSQYYGHPPSMSNGYSAPAKPMAYDRHHNRGQLDPASTWSRSQADAAAGQRYQGGPYQPHVPGGHHRNRSTGDGHGRRPNPPYRVLHSYNSPAYRHAPIWG